MNTSRHTWRQIIGAFALATFVAAIWIVGVIAAPGRPPLVLILCALSPYGVMAVVLVVAQRAGRDLTRPSAAADELAVRRRPALADQRAGSRQLAQPPAVQKALAGRRPAAAVAPARRRRELTR
jgi:hypothetical protein